MGKYIVTSGQNIYDVALHLYGSVEGIVDLMMNNTSLSLCDILKPGDELIYTDDFIINADVVSYYKMNNIIPANGERSVYYKSCDLSCIAEIYLDKNITTTEFTISGNGVLLIDWGDNSPIHTIPLTTKEQAISHFFDNQIPTDRKIRFYGSIIMNTLDLTKLFAKSVFLISPIYIEKFRLEESKVGISFICLFEGTYQIILKKSKLTNLLPLLNCKKLMELDLTGAFLDRTVLDQYLISLVNRHYGRRNCSITLTTKPSGEYKEPLRDDENNYVITSGMEAVWLLVNEPAWNEGGSWKFTINQEVYCNP